MFIVIVALGTTDLLFALDSIPAIYGLTKEPFLVLTANIFALMGLRQLYFLIGGLLERLIYLSYGLAFLLGFIGVKLILHALHENELPFINGGHHVALGPGHPDLALAAGHHRHARRHHRRLADRVLPDVGRRAGRRHRPPSRLGERLGRVGPSGPLSLVCRSPSWTTRPGSIGHATQLNGP